MAGKNSFLGLARIFEMLFNRKKEDAFADEKARLRKLQTTQQVDKAAENVPVSEGKLKDSIRISGQFPKVTAERTTVRKPTEQEIAKMAGFSDPEVYVGPAGKQASLGDADKNNFQYWLGSND